jgi:hypothetical protein
LINQRCRHIYLSQPLSLWGNEPTPCVSRISASFVRVSSSTIFSSRSSLRFSAALLSGCCGREGEWMSMLSSVLPIVLTQGGSSNPAASFLVHRTDPGPISFPHRPHQPKNHHIRRPTFNLAAGRRFQNVVVALQAA